MIGFGPEEWLLVALFLTAAGMTVWAALTGDPVAPPRPVRPALHSREARQERTQRLRPPMPPPPWMIRDGGQAQPLPAPEDLPWQAHDDRPMHNRPPRPRPRPLD